MATKLYPFQLEGAKAIEHFGGCAILADEMGLGKSLQSLWWCFRVAKKKLRPVLIVCPASLKWNWQREAAHHLDLPSEILSGRQSDKSRNVTKTAPILIINYDILKDWVPYLAELNPQAIIFDETHYLANRRSQRYKAARLLCSLAMIPHRIALSGTPLTNRPADLWSTLSIVRPDLFPNFFAFGFKYCRPRMIMGHWVFDGAKNLDKLHAILARECMVRRLKADVLSQLPAKIRTVVPVELGPKSRIEYEYARNNFLHWLKTRAPSRVHRAKKAIHLTKIGYLLRLVAKLKRHRIKAWIQDFHARHPGRKLVVFSSHRRMVEFLHEDYRHQSVVIDGTVVRVKRQHAVDQFQRSPRHWLAICNPKAAGVGLNMTAAADVAFVDFPWAPGTLKQGEDRVHRIGQTRQCHIWFLAAVATIEDKLCQLLMTKQSILDQVLDGLTTGSDLSIFKELLKETKRRTKR